MSPIVLIYIFVILAVGRLVYLLEPWGISVDESTYLAVAEAWHRYGKLYVDAIDRKPPLVYGLYYLYGIIFGFWNIHGPHIAAFLITFYLCWMAEKVAQRLPNPPRPGFTALLYAIISSCFVREFICSNSEIGLLIPLSLSYWILVSKPWAQMSHRSTLGWMIVSAGFAAMATLLKQVAALPFAVSTILLAFHFLRHRELKKVFSISVAILLGVSVVYGFTAYLFYRAGSFDDFIYWNLTDNFAYIRDSKLLDKNPRPLFSPLLVTLIAWPSLWWGMRKFFKYHRTDFKNLNSLMMFGSVIGGFGIVYVSGRLFSHYFVPVSWLFVVFAAPYVYRISLGSSRKVLIAGLALPFMICFALTTFRDPLYALFRPGEKSHTFDRSTQSQLQRVAVRIKELSSPQDRIVVWGMASQLYMMSERGSGTRFIPADYVSGRLGGMHSSAMRPAPRALELYLMDMENKKPKLFIDTASAGLNDYQWFQVENYPPLQNYLRHQYQLVENFEGFNIWKLNERESKVPSK